MVGDGCRLKRSLGSAWRCRELLHCSNPRPDIFCLTTPNSCKCPPTNYAASMSAGIVHFMFHDRVSFGGSLIAIAVLYLWLAEFPLKAGEAWAWWTLLLSGVVGFGSFLTYLGYGYLDTWHGAATLVLLPCFVVGLSRSRRRVLAMAACGSDVSRQSILRPGTDVQWVSMLALVVDASS